MLRQYIEGNPDLLN